MKIKFRSTDLDIFLLKEKYIAATFSIIQNNQNIGMRMSIQDAVDSFSNPMHL